MSRRTRRLRRPPRWRSALIAVVGIGVATWFVTLVPRDTVVEEPFELEAGVGQTLELDYGSLTVTDVRLAEAISGTEGALAGGVFVVVDTVWQATDRHTLVGGAELVDTDGRSHYATTRGGCSQSASIYPAFAQRITYCFDVDPEALPGVELRLGRGGQGSDGAFQRRDAIAVVDLALKDATAIEGTKDAPLLIEATGPVGPESPEEGNG